MEKAKIVLNGKKEIILELNKGETEEQLHQRVAFIQGEHKKIDLEYEWKEEMWDAEWYLLKAEEIKADFETWKTVVVPAPTKLLPDNRMETYVTTGIKAYKIPIRGHIFQFQSMKATAALVSETFKNFCEERQIRCTEFVWAIDKGKFEAPVFYRLVNLKKCRYDLSYIARGEWKLRFGGTKKLKDIFGPNWNALYRYGFSMCQVKSSYHGKTHFIVGEPPEEEMMLWSGRILISRKLARLFMEEGFIKETQISGCYFVSEDLKPNLTLQKDRSLNWYYLTEEEEFLTEDERKAITVQQEAYYKMEHPKRQVTRKEVINNLKKLKREEPNNFTKPLPKKTRESLIGTKWERLIEFFAVSDGMELGEDFRLLSYAEMLDSNRRYQQLREEEKEYGLPEGIQIGDTGCGDVVILTDGNEVLHYCHEGWELEEKWPSLDLFIWENVEEVN